MRGKPETRNKRNTVAGGYGTYECERESASIAGERRRYGGDDADVVVSQSQASVSIGLITLVRKRLYSVLM